MGRVLVVGSGLTGGVSSFLLRTKLNLPSVCFDKAKGVGGRMTTARGPGHSECKVDLGAQYVKATHRHFHMHKKYYKSLLSENILSPMTCVVDGYVVAPDTPVYGNFVSPDGMATIVKHFFRMSDAEIKFQHLVKQIDVEGKQVKVTTSNGYSDTFDSVVLTMPVPQVFDLTGDISQMISHDPDLTTRLKQVEYSSRYCLALFFDRYVNLGVNYSAKYLPQDPIFRFMSIDNEKRDVSHPSPTSVIFHTSVPFGKENLEKKSEEIQPLLEVRYRELYPNWPKPRLIRCHKWRYSQVTRPFDSASGAVVINQDPLIVLGGDGFTHSNFDGCIQSAEGILREFQNKYKKIRG